MTRDRKSPRRKRPRPKSVDLGHSHSQPNQDASPGTPGELDVPGNRPTLRARFLISILVVGHLLAVFLPPMAFQTQGLRGISPSVLSVLRPIEGYAQFLYLDRGYAFFAPDPGPSHLLRAVAAETPNDLEPPTLDEEESSSVTIPNLESQWPRLLYHRHFMLSEFLHENFEPALPEGVEAFVGNIVTREEIDVLQLGRRRYEAIANSMRRRFAQELGAPSATLARVEHRQPDFVSFALDPISLDDARLRGLLPDIELPLEEIEAMAMPTLPQPAMGVEPTDRESVPVPEPEPTTGTNDTRGNRGDIAESSSIDGVGGSLSGE
ncbi:MAG: hypothetical protein AAGD07_05625 [Planctomycetota bacterium]